jgi:hypothetical protein
MLEKTNKHGELHNIKQRLCYFCARLSVCQFAYPTRPTKFNPEIFMCTINWPISFTQKLGNPIILLCVHLTIHSFDYTFI